MSVWRRSSATFATIAAVALAACGGDGGETALDRDSALARDLARAGMDSAAQPQLEDVPEPKAEPAPEPPRTQTPPRRTTPASPTPSTPAPTPAPEPTPPAGTTVTKEAPGSEPAVAAIPAGTTLALSAVDKVCTNTHKVGDRFTATLDEAVTGANGAVIPAGAKVTIEITELHKSENVNDKIVMGFRVVSLAIGDRNYYPEADVVSAEIDRVRASTTGDDAKKVLGGAVAGAIIGQIIGKDRKGTLIGAAAGAAAGAGAAAATADYDGCVDTGSAITVRLTGPLTVATGA